MMIEVFAVSVLYWGAILGLLLWLERRLSRCESMLRNLELKSRRKDED